MKRILQFAVLLLVGCAGELFAVSTNWTLSLVNGSSTWSASESNYSVTASGTFTRLANGFVKLTVTASAGTYAPSVSSVKYLVELPETVTLVQPLLTNETELIYLVTAGTCPTTTQNHIWIFGHWDRSGANNMTSTSQPAFGTSTYTPGSPSSYTLNAVYDVHSNAAISGFSSFSLNGTCSSGTVPISGSGDRGGTVYVTSGGSTFFRTNGNKGVLAIPQISLPLSPNDLTGSYSGFRYTSSTTPDIRPMRMSVSNWGYDVDGNALSDIDNNTPDGSFAEILTIDNTNSPVAGMVRGRILRGAQEGSVSCAVMRKKRTVLFCAGQSPDANAEPFNLVLVSDAFRFTKGQGLSGTEFNGVEMGTVGAWVRDTAYDSVSGKTYFAGRFTAFQGTSVRHLIRLNSDSSLDTSFLPTFYPQDVLTSIVLATDGSGDIYVAGNFTQFNGTARERLLRLNSDGSLDTAFDSSSGFDSVVHDLAIAADGSNKLYAAGEFYSYAGNYTNAKMVVRLNTDGTLDNTFATGTGPSGGVSYAHMRRVLPLSDGKVYIGGDFDSFDGTANKNGILRLTSAGAIDSGFNVGTDGFNHYVTALALALDGSNDLYVGGKFTSYRGSTNHSNHIIRLNSDGSHDTGFASGVGLSVTVGGVEVADIAVVPTGHPSGTPGDIYISGWFEGAGAESRTRLVRYNSDGSVDGAFPDRYIWYDPLSIQLTTTSGMFWLGGEMVGFGGLNVRSIVAVDVDGNIDSDAYNGFGPSGFDNSVTFFGLAAANDGSNDIYAAGDFRTFNTANSRGIARLTENGTLDYSMTFNDGDLWGYGPNLSGGFAQVTVTSDGEHLYLTGPVTSVDTSGGNVAVSQIARFTKAGVLDTTFAQGTGFDDITYGALALTGGDVLVWGDFTTYNGTASKGIIQLNSNGTVDSGFSVGTGFGPVGFQISQVAAAADGSGDYYVAGIFTSYRGSSYTNLLRINSDGTIDAAFATGSGLNSEAWTVLPLADGKVYVAGDFATYNGSSVGKIIRLNSNGTLDSSFDTAASGGFDWAVATISVANDGSGDLYAGGYFTTYRGVTANKIARLNSDGTADAGFNSGAGFSSGVRAIIPVPGNSTGQIYVGGDFGAYDGYPADYIARIRGNGASD